MAPKKASSGFTLIQISLLLTMASLAVVATLPSSRAKLDAGKISAEKMNSVLKATRQYQAAHGFIPCPADPNLATGNSSYGVASANSGATSNCSGGLIYAPTSSPNHIAVGTVPVRTLGLSSDYAVDGFNRNITYAVDTGATACWTSPTMQGSVKISDNNVNFNSVIALVSHGADGFGAWLPLPGTGSGATRLNTGSTNNSQADNAQVARGGGLSNNGAAASFVNGTPSTSFDDQVIYQTPLFNLNSLPNTITNISISPPSNGSYTSGQTWTFTLTTPYAVTVTGTPYLQLTALSGGNLSAHATYVSGSSTSTSLVFKYTILASDTAPNGISLGSSVVGTTSPCITFNPPDLSQVVIASTIAIANFGGHYITVIDSNGNFIRQLGTTNTSGTRVTRLKSPAGVAIDSAGNYWVADTGNDRVSEFDTTGTWKRTIGGNTTDTCAGYYTTSTSCGYVSGTACCAFNATSCTCHAGNALTTQFDMTTNSQMFFDTSGYLWVMDVGGTNTRLAKFDTSGNYMGTTTTSISGYTSGAALDSSGYLWIMQPGNSVCRLARCNANGSGCVSHSSCSTGGTAGTFYTTGNGDTDEIAIDSGGNIWVTDESNCQVQKYNPTTDSWSIPFTFSLADCSPGSGVGPAGIAIDSNGYIWVANDNNNYVYQLKQDGTILQKVGHGSTGTTGSTPINLSNPYQIYISR
ncbi:MAG TPA: hypothetical protein VFT64_02530 [Rickettsiales bacterium]|nr:hypothetical protein [Rickettsiales bacterium]